MKTARVVLDIATSALDDAYTYCIPAGMEDLVIGCAVQVPFGHRKAVGFVVGFNSSPEAPTKLKPVERVLTRSFFNEDSAACAQYIAKRYIAPLSACVRLFTPPGGVPRMVRAAKGYWHLEQPAVGEIDERWVALTPEAHNFEPKKNAVKQKAILEALKRGELRVAELTAEYGSVNAALSALEKRGVVRIEVRRRNRAEGVLKRSSATVAQRPVLTAGPAQALSVIQHAQQVPGGGRVVLVDGVTGSGKTEVYLRAIEDVIAAGKTAIVLVPEISLTPQTVARFRGRFGNAVAVLHSRMSAGERYDQWDFIASGAARVVVGARSALFSPVKNLGLIIIDEEHEGSYKQDQAPRYVARDVADWMVKRTGATLVLGSATPSIEAIYNVHERPDWDAVLLPERANGKPMPEVEVIDMAHEFAGGARSMFSKRLQELVFVALKADDKVVLLLNQRGFAQFLLCRECGFVPECPSCSTSLTYHEYGQKLICHHCGYSTRVPQVCPACGSPYLKRFGAGTQRVEAELAALLQQEHLEYAAIIRMDADTTARKGAHQKLLEQFAKPGPAVLLGTQMIAKGLDFDDVVLVGVINADTQLRLPDFRAAERTFDLIEQVAGRAGRAEKPGLVCVQTYSAHTGAIVAAATYDRARFLREELPKRKSLGYPPYVRLADVLCWGANESDVQVEAQNLFDLLRAHLEACGVQGWVMLPPVACVLSRVRNNFRYHITIKAPRNADIGAVLEPVFRARKINKAVNVSIDIDPQSLL